MRTVIGTFLLIIAILRVEAFYEEKNSAVSVVGPKQFNRLVLESDLVSVVEFFAPWCDMCKQLAPQYSKVAEKLQVCAADSPKSCFEPSLEAFTVV